MPAEKLTDKDLFTGQVDPDNDLVHFVDVSDTSQDPEGSSFKATPRSLGFGEIFTFARELTVAEVLSGNSSPVELIPAPGAGKFIAIIEANCNLVFNGTFYTINQSFSLIHPSATTGQFVGSNTLGQAASRWTKLSPNSPNSIAVVENEPINFKVNTGDPGAGDSTITIFGAYYIFNLDNTDIPT